MDERRILVVDDDPDTAGAIADTLAVGNTQCEIAASGAAAIAACKQFDFDAVVTDMRMAGMDGLELLAHLKSAQPELPVILLTAEGSIAAAVEAVKRGAFQYLTKPCEPVELRGVVDQAVTAHAREKWPHGRPIGPNVREDIVGSSAAISELRSRIDLVAAAASPVLVLGETGTGKELVARAVHACSLRRTKPFVTVNVSAIPEALLESQMFGHVRGAFTGATQAHRGLFAEAHGGTLLLDEIGDMALALQAKLLRVLQDGTFRPVGGDREQHADVRIVAATHRKLPELVKASRFREDLYYRLNVVTVHVPPLRKRSEDIEELATWFLDRARTRAPGSPARSFSPELLEIFVEARWPGNVRELQSVVERLVVLARGPELTPVDLARADHKSDEVEEPEEAKDTDPGLDNLIRRHVERVLARAGGNKTRAAKLLGVDLSTLYRWQRKWEESES